MANWPPLPEGAIRWGRTTQPFNGAMYAGDCLTFAAGEDIAVENFEAPSPAAPLARERGWCRGMLLREAKRGWFPVVCFEEPPAFEEHMPVQGFPFQWHPVQTEVDPAIAHSVQLNIQKRHALRAWQHAMYLQVMVADYRAALLALRSRADDGPPRESVDHAAGGLFQAIRPYDAKKEPDPGYLALEEGDLVYVLAGTCDAGGATNQWHSYCFACLGSRPSNDAVWGWVPTEALRRADVAGVTRPRDCPSPAPDPWPEQS